LERIKLAEGTEILEVVMIKKRKKLDVSTKKTRGLR
jgi:hypothetical protein